MRQACFQRPRRVPHYLHNPESQNSESFCVQWGRHQAERGRRRGGGGGVGGGVAGGAGGEIVWGAFRSAVQLESSLNVWQGVVAHELHFFLLILHLFCLFSRAALFLLPPSSPSLLQVTVVQARLSCGEMTGPINKRAGSLDASMHTHHCARNPFSKFKYSFFARVRQKGRIQSGEVTSAQTHHQVYRQSREVY